MREEPAFITTEEELDEILSRPAPESVEHLRRLDGDILLIGAGGKMGPSLARMMRRGFLSADTTNRIIAVSGFTSPGVRDALERDGIDTIVCDAIDAEQLARLPDAPNILFLAGRKFGSRGNEPLTWALNSYLPGMVMQRFPRSRIVALSTGNVYPFVPVDSRGAKETDEPRPVGEYAQSCLGRERIIQYWSARNGTPVAIIRLNYAVEMRYGLLLDIARNVLEGVPIDLRMGYMNVIWQGDANNGILLTLSSCSVPPTLLNMTGREVLAVRAVAEEFARHFQKEVSFSGREEETALLSDAARFHEGCPFEMVSASTMIRWIAHWIRTGGVTWDKPTLYGVRDGNF